MANRRKRIPTTLFDAILDGGGGEQRSRLYGLAKDSEYLIERMERYKTAKVHHGCVNSICWNESGTLLLSASDDTRIKITDVFAKQPKVLVDWKTPHKSNIFCARFLPLQSDRKVVSCSGDGMIYYTNLDLSYEENSKAKFNCHEGTCYKIVTVPNEPHSFLSCGEDHTVRFYDLRMKNSCSCVKNPSDILVCAKKPVTSIAVNPLIPWYLAVGTADSCVRIFDRRKLAVGSKPTCLEAQLGSEVKRLTVPALQESDRTSYRITSLTWSSCGNQILASYSSDHLYLFDTRDGEELNGRQMEVPKLSNLEMVPVKKVKTVAKPPMKRLRLRGDWSDTGPNARPQTQAGGEIAQARPTLQQSLMERMTFVLSQMLNDVNTNSGESPPSTRTNGHVNPPEENQNQNQPSEEGNTSVGTSSDQLEDQLASLRSSFVRNHNVEPGAVNLSYREGGSNAGLISMSVGSESERGVSTIPMDTEQPTSSANAKRMWKESEKIKTGGKILMKFTGHRNSRTMIKEANFYGEKYVISGSDCGHVFIWERMTGRLVQVLEADNHVVNNVQPHPFDPIIATSGIDYDIKLFAPVAPTNTFNMVKAKELMNRNSLMLEETRDTITVPAAFMIRMLSCLSHIRRNNTEAAAAAVAAVEESNEASAIEPPPPPNSEDVARKRDEESRHDEDDDDDDDEDE